MRHPLYAPIGQRAAVLAQGVQAILRRLSTMHLLPPLLGQYGVTAGKRPLLEAQPDTHVVSRRRHATRTGDQSIGPGDTDRNAENEGVAEDARDLCPGGCERRLAHPQRLEDLLMHVCLEVDTRDLFDEPRKDPIVGVRVGPIGARCEGQSATSQVGSCFTWRPWPFCVLVETQFHVTDPTGLV